MLINFFCFFLQVDTGYPRSTTKWWLGCQSGAMNETPDMEEDTGADMKIIDNEDSGDETLNSSEKTLLSSLLIALSVIMSSLLS